MVALCLVLSLGAAAQSTARKAKGPRALALVEWPASGGSPRVIPVAILVNGRYYDASIYKADPVPMALEPGIVYEVVQSGASIGMVTLTGARQASNGAWLAEARFQSSEQLAAVAAARRPRDVTPKSATVGDDRPTLRRGGRRSGRDRTPEPTTTPEPRSEPQPAGDDAPPVLRKPASENPSPEATKPGETGSKPADKAAAPPAPPEQSSSERMESAEHPVLRRGRPTAEQAENLPGAVDAKAAPKSPAAAAGPGSAANKAAAARPGRVLPAVSDAAGPEPHTYLLPWNMDEQERLKKSMIQLASAALQDFARTHGGTHPGPLQDVQVRAFDLTTRNEPQIVLMAHALEAPATPVRRASPRQGIKPGAAAQPPPPAGEGISYWVTIAARQDYNGDLRKLKVWATDSKHLDAYPRAELIDAVDADGDGRGELLFREISDVGQSFVLYRATPDTLTQLFNSAGLEH
jgi:hypothetical protein